MYDDCMDTDNDNVYFIELLEVEVKTLTPFRNIYKQNTTRDDEMR